MVLYYLSYPNELKNLKTLIKPDYFEYIGWFLYQIGGIPSTNIARKNGGNLVKIVDILKSSKSSQLLISPKGSIMKSEWKTGYFYIAKSLHAPLIAIGVDYDDKKINIGSLIDYQLDENEIKHKLYKDLSNIVPLYPEREMMKIRKYNHISVIDPNCFIGIYFLSIIGIAFYLY
jgi:1-acyl-sn-glycerol-3-phosphate acyltransferase